MKDKAGGLISSNYLAIDSIFSSKGLITHGNKVSIENYLNKKVVF